MPTPLRFTAFGMVLLTTVLAAHDVEISVQLAAPVAITRATYAGSDPVSFAQVSIHKPGSETEYQTGRTDANGYFTFVPDGPGAWRVTVDDELGHRSDSTVSVPSPFDSKGPVVAAGLSTPLKALLGLSLIVGITGFLYGYKVRK